MNISCRENLIFGGLVGVLAITGIAVGVSPALAETDSSDVVTVVVPSSCSVGSTIATGSEHSTDIRNGIYKPDIGETTITTFCNDNEGYSVYAIGFSDDTLGKTVLSSSLDDSYDIATGTATGPVGNNDVSNWAMKLTAVSGTFTPTILDNYDAYHVVPSSYAKVATFPSQTDIVEGSSIKTTYAVYASKNQVADTYTSKVKYTVIHPNNGEAPVMPATFTWQDSTATRPNDEDIEITFQDFDTDTCELGTTGQIGWLKDPRDNQTYQIAKLADGKCWMVENLNLAGGTALSPDNTDVTSEYITDYTAGDSRLAKSGNTLVLPASATAGFNTNNYSYVYNSGNKTNCGASGQNTPCYSYYSWDAATLGSGRSIATENTDAPYSICPKGWRLPTSGNSSNNEWKRGDFYALATAYGANLESSYYDDSSATGANFYNNAGPGTIPGFLLAGWYYGSLFSGGGSGGLYWSSASLSSTSRARGLSFGSSSVDSAYRSGRSYGFGVRCLFSGQ